jgi:hypothetical protein
MASSGYFTWDRLKPAQKGKRCRYEGFTSRSCSSAAQKERGHSYKENGSKENGCRSSSSGGCFFSLRRSGRSRTNVVKLNGDGNADGNDYDCFGGARLLRKSSHDIVDHDTNNRMLRNDDTNNRMLRNDDTNNRMLRNDDTNHRMLRNDYINHRMLRNDYINHRVFGNDYINHRVFGNDYINHRVFGNDYINHRVFGNIKA